MGGGALLQPPVEYQLGLPLRKGLFAMAEACVGAPWGVAVEWLHLVERRPGGEEKSRVAYKHHATGGEIYKHTSKSELRGTGMVGNASHEADFKHHSFGQSPD